MKKILYTAMAVLTLGLSSCIDSLNQDPIVDFDSNAVYSSAYGCKQALGKLYVSFVTYGQQQGGEDPDLSTSGKQSFDFMRYLINLQEGGTDEMVITYAASDNLADISYLSWSDTDPWVTDFYYRIYYNIAMCNDFLKHTTEDVIAGYPEQADRDQVHMFRAEARFLRALCYYYVLDMFGQGPYVDENTPNVDFMPPAYNSSQLFDFIEDELTGIEDQMAQPAGNEYGRADRAAAWTLLARLYLNAEVYTGTGRYTDCITYCKKIIDSGMYRLADDYASLFNADNHLRTNEIIYLFPVGVNTVSWGATTYLCAGSVSSNSTVQDPVAFGLNTDGGAWGMFRMRGEFAALFGEDAAAIDASKDSRAMICTHSTDGTEIPQWLDNGVGDDATGFRYEKWVNITDGGTAGTTDSGTFGVEIDYPVFRLADVYLMAAEAVLRGGTGYTRTDALDFVNELRDRAYQNDPTDPADTDGQITDAQLNLDFIIDERGRELYLECVRRTDLIRFGRFTSDQYLWQWKGGVLNGRGVDSRYNVYPIPANEIAVNTNLSNPNY